MNVKIKYPVDYLDEEVRDGYVISEKMKKVWLVEMDILCELDRICKKYNIKYFADSGTLLGAVRDGGFIPWDDDIDIVMMRDDYERFIEVATGELKKPYFLQSVLSSENYSTRHIKIRNSDTTGIQINKMDREINHGINIDVFPLDYLPENKLVFALFSFKLRCIAKVLTRGIDYKYIKPKGIKSWIIGETSKFIFGLLGKEKIYNKLHECSKKYNSRKTSKVGYISYSLGKKKHIWDASCFDEAIMCPFEFIEIPIPKGYDSRLRVEYGDYNVKVKAAATHGGCIFEPDIPYKDYIKNIR